MASSNTSTQPAKEGTGLDFPGRAVYIRTTNEDVQAPGHQARVENWIHDSLCFRTQSSRFGHLDWNFLRGNWSCGSGGSPPNEHYIV